MSLLETAKRIFTGRKARELEHARVTPHGVPPIPEYNLHMANWRQPMIPKIIGYRIKEFGRGTCYYWAARGQGYVDELSDAHVYTAKELSGFPMRLRLMHKTLRLVPVYEKETDHERT